jgi:hypothetical protein
MWVFYGLLAFLVGGHLYDGVRGQEHWPFSNYPMFRGIASPDRTTYQIVFVTDEPTPRELPAKLDWVPSLPMYKFLPRIESLASPKSGNPEKLRKEMTDYLTTYQTRQAKGLNDGPKVQALRLYRVTFKLELPFKPMDMEASVPPGAEQVLEVNWKEIQAGGSQ